jgi:hypothetical protein
MNINEIKNKAESELSDVLRNLGPGEMFTVTPLDVLVDQVDSDGVASIEFQILFQYGNCEYSHSIVIGYNDTDGIGIEYGEDGDIQSITYGNVMASLYFDLALKGLDDKYIH